MLKMDIGFNDQVHYASQKSEARVDNADNINIETLPSYLRNFIRLQHEAAGRDVGQIEFMMSPGGITSLSQDGTKYVEEEKRKLRHWWYEFLMTQLKTMSEMFVKTWEKIEVAERILDDFEQQLKGELENSQFNGASSRLKDEIKDFKDDLQSFKKQLREQPEPNTKDLQKIQDNVNSRLDQIKSSFQNAKEICKHASRAFANCSAAIYFKSLGLFRGNNLENDFKIAEDYTSSATQENANLSASVEIDDDALEHE